VRWEANRAKNERQHVQEQKERLKDVARASTMTHGEENPSKSESSREDEGDEDGEEGEIIFPRALPPESLLSLGDIFGRQMGADAGEASSLPSQPDLALVCFILLGMCACITGAWMTYLPYTL
jgi:hypothetical protein